MHHVIVRGIEKREIFRDDRDRSNLHGRLTRVLLESGVACFGWTFMPNHVHLVVRTGETPLAVAMARVNTGYARYFNERHARVGHLFQNRYKALAVFDDEHLLTCVRYVHLNPLRAGLVADLEALARYPWTGHAVLMGRASAPFQATGELRSCFSGGDVSGPQLSAWMHENQEVPGPESLCFRHLAELVGRAFSVAPQEIEAGRRTRRVVEARGALAFLASRILGLKPPGLCRRLGVSRQAALQAVLRGERAVARVPSLARLLES
jgi:REP element-mobilizing transposase RayT